MEAGTSKATLGGIENFGPAIGLALGFGFQHGVPAGVEPVRRLKADQGAICAMRQNENERSLPVIEKAWGCQDVLRPVLLTPARQELLLLKGCQ